ncbi:competence type IV pilus minor pilin ComGD [Saliterribacillus persicus]|uniref:Competence protein ComGD n=1 Tax=Saliterribacillus persicus TaxID=930114 RepID=A0A368XBP0_9BACI|nr:competence type IV pilus minor pilin ComGD [Saliterribacillus persicus]RCW65382.1 competence protein ComGD [Saliterribacillus persicus]
MNSPRIKLHEDIKEQKGFTLIETLLVLSVLIIFLSIGGAFHYKTFDSYQYQTFYQLFEKDIIYLQQLSVTSNDSYALYFDLSNNSYQIKKSGIGTILLSREFPKAWTIRQNTLKLPLSFSKDGTIKNPGAIKVETTHNDYFITFPFGKGRCYSEKSK